REAQVRETGAQLPPDESLCMLQASDRGPAPVGLADDTDLHDGVAQIGAELDLGNRGHPDTGILEVAHHDLADFLSQLCGDAFASMTAHGFILLASRRESVGPAPGPRATTRSSARRPAGRGRPRLE